MKKDYLWNKTGSDAGVEQLEDALATFRYQTNEPPALPATLLVLPEKRSFGFFTLGLVFAVSLVVIASIVWMRFATIGSPNERSVVAKQGDIQNLPITPIESNPPVVETPGIEKHFVKTVQPIRIPTKRIHTVARRSESKPGPEKLTQQEKYAYGQLMLALAITSNELKIVRDKINGREERNAADDRQK
ncbi:MAG: hypothetical protein ABI878_09590 [Acidobacteriota bacterium]